MSKKAFVIGITCFLLLPFLSTVSAITTKTTAQDVIIYHEQSTDISSSEGDIAKWTVIAYLDGDNNLEDLMLNSLDNMEMVGSTEEVEVVAQIDRIRYGDDFGNTWETTRRYHVTYDNDMKHIGSELIQDFGELNMGDPNVLVDFVCWAIDNYPAEHYYLALVDHGGAWEGICYDETDDDDCLTLNDLKIAFDSINEHLKNKQPDKDKIDVVFFFACIMGSIEVYYKLKDCFDLGISSEDVGVCYPEINVLLRLSLEELNQNPYINPITIAEETARNCVEYDEISGNNTFDDASVINPSKNNIDTLVEKTNILATLLKEALPTYKSAIKMSAFWAPQFWGPIDYICSTDLYTFASNIKKRISDSEIKNAAQEVMDAVEEVVIKTFSNTEYWFDIRHGLSIMLFYFPDDGPVPEEYIELDFAKDTQWDEFVNEFLNSLKKSSFRSRVLGGMDYYYRPVLIKLFSRFGINLKLISEGKGSSTQSSKQR